MLVSSVEQSESVLYIYTHILSLLDFPPIYAITEHQVKILRLYSIEKREPSYTVGENVNCTTTMNNSMEVPLKTKNRTTTWSSSPTTGHIPQENYNSERHRCSFQVTEMLPLLIHPIDYKITCTHCPNSNKYGFIIFNFYQQ